MAGRRNLDAVQRAWWMLGWGEGSQHSHHSHDLKSNMVLVYSGNVTLAQINAGIVLIPGFPLRRIEVLDYYIKANGAFGALTALVLEGTDGNDITSIPQAELADNAVFRRGVGTQTVTDANAGPNALAAGVGVQLTKTGSTATTATGAEVIIWYRYAA